LQQALDQQGGSSIFNLSITRMPFFLYPGGDHPIKPWGERVDALYSPHASRQLGELGKAAGYHFDFSARLSDTMDSHRLVLWAERQAGKGEAVAHAMGRQYFEGARLLADRQMLREAAEEVGLDAAAAASYLASDEGFEEVRKSVASLQRAGVHSIPIFAFKAGGFSEAVHGSADTARFSRVLQAIREHWTAQQEDEPGRCTEV